MINKIIYATLSSHMTFIDENISLEKCPALVLNADYRPLSYYPLSLWSWQDSIKSVYLDRVTIVTVMIV